MSLEKSSGDFMYHLAGADIDVSKGVSSKHLLSYTYRFSYEDTLLYLLVRRYKPKRVLDAGCGTARASQIFSQFKEIDIDAFDLSENMIIENRKRFKSKDINFFVADFNSAILDLNAYDMVFVGGVFMCMSNEEVQQAIMKIKKAMKKNAILIVRDTIAKEDVGRYSDIKNIRSLNEELQLFKSAGLQVNATYNGANKSFLLSAFNYVPISLVKSVVVQYILFLLLKISARKNAEKEIKKNAFIRNEISNQIYFICKVF